MDKELSSAKGGEGFTVPHYAGEQTYQIQLGLQRIQDMYSEDGLPLGFTALAIHTLLNMSGLFFPLV